MLIHLKFSILLTVIILLPFIIKLWVFERDITTLRERTLFTGVMLLIPIAQATVLLLNLPQ